MAAVPVLEVGGTHVTAAIVDAATWTVATAGPRVDIDSHGTADELVAGFASAADGLPVPAAARWAVAMPDPFDYEHGIGRFHGVGKFDALDGVDVRAALCAQLPGQPGGVTFLNDADAFTLGEWAAGAGAGTSRCVGMTLGTGVGTGWVDRGRVVDPGVPLGGRAHRLDVDGGPLEDTMSRRAIRRAYAAASGDAAVDVREIAERARAGDEVAEGVLAHALEAAGRALAPPIRRFGADVLVVGGSMAGSWPLFVPWFVDGCGPGPFPAIRVAEHPDTAGLVGAARHISG